MEKVVYVIGSFDLFHRGHVELLRRARALGDRLIVAINGDDIVEKYKRRPYIKEDDRLAVVQACRYVDEAFVIHTFDNKEVICKYGINIIVPDGLGNIVPVLFGIPSIAIPSLSHSIFCKRGVRESIAPGASFGI